MVTQKPDQLGEQVIQTAHVLTQAHRAVIGTQGEEREIRRSERKKAERRLFQACDAHRRAEP